MAVLEIFWGPVFLTGIDTGLSSKFGKTPILWIEFPFGVKYSAIVSFNP